MIKLHFGDYVCYYSSWDHANRVPPEERDHRYPLQAIRMADCVVNHLTREVVKQRMPLDHYLDQLCVNTIFQTKPKEEIDG